ncbi:hypothetical protein [Actinoplanes sp. NPDC049599]|uniref:hypothetical protein n=1 Tax=Actinoplanes sp. NPDC049599 TaxID=3363903 RepID=UPI0037990C71
MHRIGTLVIHAAGPGSSGWSWVRTFAPSVLPEIRDRFDIVGLDHRGVQRSQPLSGPAYQRQRAAVRTRPAPGAFRTAARLARHSRYTGSYRARGSAPIPG